MPFLPDLYRLRALTALRASVGDMDAVVADLRLAIKMARDQGARSLELRAARDLARLWAERGERQRAFDLLSPVYAWFTEGFDMPDLERVQDPSRAIVSRTRAAVGSGLSAKCAQQSLRRFEMGSIEHFAIDGQHARVASRGKGRDDASGAGDGLGAKA